MSLISFAGLETLIEQVVEGQKTLQTQVGEMDKVVSTLASRAEMQDNEKSFNSSLQKLENGLDRLDQAQRGSQRVLDGLPELQQELNTRMTELEQRLSQEINNTVQMLGGRLTSAETELRGKASSADIRNLATEIDDRVRRDEAKRLNDLLARCRRARVRRPSVPLPPSSSVSAARPLTSPPPSVPRPLAAQGAGGGERPDRRHWRAYADDAFGARRQAR